MDLRPEDLRLNGLQETKKRPVQSFEQFAHTQLEQVFVRVPLDFRRLRVFSTAYAQRLAEKDNPVAYFLYLGFSTVLTVISMLVIFSFTASAFSAVWAKPLLPFLLTIVLSATIGFGLARLLMFVLGRSVRRFVLGQMPQHHVALHDPTETIRVNSDYVRIVRPENMIQPEEDDGEETAEEDEFEKAV